MIDTPGEPAGPPRPPRPELRRDVMDERYRRPAYPARHAESEARRIDADDDSRMQAPDGIGSLANAAQEGRKARKDIREAHDGDVRQGKQTAQPLPGHSLP